MTFVKRRRFLESDRMIILKLNIRGKWFDNFKCDFCGMVADSGIGLNSHIKAKHIVFMGFLQADGGQE